MEPVYEYSGIHKIEHYIKRTNTEQPSPICSSLQNYKIFYQEQDHSVEPVYEYLGVHKIEHYT